KTKLLFTLITCYTFVLQAQTYVPDDIFEQALIDLGYDSGPLDDYVPTANISGLTSLNVSWMNISNLAGIEDFALLETLNCRGNLLTTIDLSSNLALTSLDCSQNMIIALDLTTNTNLSILNCSQNQIEELDLSLHPNLSRLNCKNNQLSELNIKNGGNTNFVNWWDFSANFNPDLECIQVDDVSYSASWLNIDNQSYFLEDCNYGFTYVPDDNFEQALIDLGYDSGPLDDYIDATNISSVTTLDVSNKNILDLTGIRSFVALEILNCSQNQLSVLSIDNLSNLKELDFSSNNFSGNLNFNSNTLLEILNGEQNQLTSINLYPTLLEELRLSNNNISYISQSNFPNLRVFEIASNNYSTQDILSNLSITHLNLNDNLFENLDFSQHTNLVSLQVVNNNLYTLNLKNNSNTTITTFEATGNTNLTCIEVDDTNYSTTNWTAIDSQTSYSTSCSIPSSLVYVPDDTFESYLISEGKDNFLDNYVLKSNMSTVTTIDIQGSDWFLSELSDLTGIEACVNLINLTITWNFVTSIDLSANLNLEKLNCRGAQFSELNLSAHSNLNWFNAEGNGLTSLNIKNGNNSNFIHFSALYNPSLTCVEVDDATYSTTNWTNIDSGTSFSENCATMSINDETIYQIKLFPNPAIDYLNIKRNNTTNLDYQIMDILGKPIGSGTMISNKINISLLKSGIYFLSLSDKKIMQTSKFIKQ
uniref:T9SS type A sorting domain-containing protein n=1 Tax=uncultured Winogradskyella sp. TaxID=395353 RepID=UPI0030D9A836